MKACKVVMLLALTFFFSSLAFADAVFGNQLGNLGAIGQSSNWYLTTGMPGSMLSSVTGAGGLNCNPCSGFVYYKTPSLGTLSAINNVGGAPIVLGSPGGPSIGGTFSISENGSTVFTGTFTYLTWTYIGTCQGATNCGVGHTGSQWYYEWALMGSVTGTYMGQQVNGATVQLTTQKFTTIKNGVVIDPFGPSGSHNIGLSGGNSTFPVVPESSTLILFGTGLVAIAVFVRRRHSAGLQG